MFISYEEKDPGFSDKCNADIASLGLSSTDAPGGLVADPSVPAALQPQSVDDLLHQGLLLREGH